MASTQIAFFYCPKLGTNFVLQNSTENKCNLDLTYRMINLVTNVCFKFIAVSGMTCFNYMHKAKAQRWKMRLSKGVIQKLQHMKYSILSAMLMAMNMNIDTI